MCVCVVGRYRRQVCVGDTKTSKTDLEEDCQFLFACFLSDILNRLLRYRSMYWCISVHTMCPQNGSQDSGTLSFQNFRMTQNNFESIVTEIALLIRAKTFWRKTITVLWELCWMLGSFYIMIADIINHLLLTRYRPFIIDSFNLHDNPLKEWRYTIST